MASQVEIVVEARGHRCPVPTLRLRRAAERAPAGAVLKLVADDPLARIDAPHFAGQAGLEVLSVSEADGAVIVRVRKPAAK
jgi:tRNA 2-thiouridine synthesizing protein A